MMEFLRGLAPRRDGDSSWAAPVVAPRFSSARPLGIESPVSEKPAAVVPDVAHVGRKIESGEPVAARRPADDVNHVLPAVATAAMPLVPQLPIRPVHHHHHEPVPVERVLPSVVSVPDLDRIVTTPVVPASPEPRTAVHVEMPAAAVRPLQEATPRQSRSHGAGVPAPLSPAALAERTATHTTPRPIVHVTIDRIEVRVPAARTATRGSRGRTPTPTVSLTDYLRGPRNGGGV